MPEPRREDLHSALATSFASSSRDAGRGTGPGELQRLLRTLADELRTDGGRRRRAPLPPAVVGLALWNLAQNQDSRTVSAPDREALDTLIEDVFGWRLAELHARRDLLRPLQVVASQYGILDYRYDAPSADGSVVEASLSLLVQRPLAEFAGTELPEQWAARCGLFWSRVSTAKGVTRAHLELPAAAGGRGRVQVRWRCAKGAFGASTETDVLRPSRGRAPALIASGVLRFEKEEGQPWATRITNSKRLHGATAADAGALDALAYWVQAETLSLVFAGPRAAAGRAVKR